MGFEFKEIGIKGLFEIIPKVYGDGRGFFLNPTAKRILPRLG